jgi:hypothetical protein
MSSVVDILRELAAAICRHPLLEGRSSRSDASLGVGTMNDSPDPRSDMAQLMAQLHAREAALTDSCVLARRRCLQAAVPPSQTWRLNAGISKGRPAPLTPRRDRSAARASVASNAPYFASLSRAFRPLSISSRPEVVSLVQTCQCHPSQWEGWTSNCNAIYVHFGHGLTVPQRPPSVTWERF